MTHSPKGRLAGTTMHMDRVLMAARALADDRKDFSGPKITKARKMASEGATIEDIRSECCPDLSYAQMRLRLKKYSITLRAGHVSNFGANTGRCNPRYPINYHPYRAKMSA